MPLRKEGIAWASDKKEKFIPNVNQPGKRPDTWNWAKVDNVSLPINDEDVIVWMRVAGLPTFKKLYRIIDEDLPAGDYTFDIISSM